MAYTSAMIAAIEQLMLESKQNQAGTQLYISLASKLTNLFHDGSLVRLASVLLHKNLISAFL